MQLSPLLVGLNPYCGVNGKPDCKDSLELADCVDAQQFPLVPPACY